MDKAAIERPELARLIFPALLGFVLGSALQLQQAVLLAWQFYAGLMLLAALPGLLAATKSIAISWRMLLAALAFGVLAFGLTSLRVSGVKLRFIRVGAIGRLCLLSVVTTNFLLPLALMEPT